MHLIVGFDVGGTITRVGVVVSNGGESPRLWSDTYREFPTPPTMAALGTYAESATAGLRGTRWSVGGVAVAVAASVRDHAVVRESPNVPFLAGKHDLDLAAQLGSLLGKPVVIANDMESALAGEVVAGTLRGCTWGFIDTISTGWGGAMLYNGVEVAAEPGHIWVGSGRGACACGRGGCAEGHYSGGAVRRRVLREVELTADARGDSSYRVPDGTDPCAFADAEYRKQEPWARLLYHDVAVAIGEIWGSRLNLCPLVQKIVYQGTFADHLFALPGLLDLVRERMIERSLFQDEHENIPIVRAEAPHGALLGAASIFQRLA